MFGRLACWPLMLIAALAAAGCGEDAPVAPRLSYKSVEFGEEYVPLPFAVRVTNSGDAEGRIDRVEAKIESVAAIPGRGLTMPSPEDFKYEVLLFGHERAGVDAEPLPAGTAMTLPGGKTSEVWCAFKWILPEDAPAMMVVCSATFTLSYRDETQVETPRLAFVLQSRPGILENMTAAPVRGRKRADRIVEVLSAAKGEPSESLRSLLEHMEEGAK